MALNQVKVVYTVHRGSLRHFESEIVLYCVYTREAE